MTKKKATAPWLTDEPSLSRAWAEAFLHVIDNPGKEITPLVVSITGFADDGTPREDPILRQALDDLLVLKGWQSIEDVAYTIFPERLWRMAGGNRAKLFKLYRMAFPRYQAMKRRLNSRGLYFERLTSYSERAPCNGNQLEWIISRYNSRPEGRRSMYQATTFDPERDHVKIPRLGFPCLQHISFEPTEQGLVANAFYATQLLLTKAYGNYLGLARLAAFMAHEMKIPLARLNVMIGIAKLDEIPKTDVSMDPLIAAARKCILAEQSTTATDVTTEEFSVVETAA
jgi:thymidylate synthase